MRPSNGLALVGWLVVAPLLANPGPAAAPPRPPALDRHGDPLPPDAVARLGTLRLGSAGPHFNLRFTPDGKIVSGCCPVHVSDVATGALVRRFDVLPKGYVPSLNVSPDGKLLVTAGSNHVITLWELATGRRLWEASAETHLVSAVAFAPDGKAVVSGCYNQTVRWWDLATGRQTRRLGTRGQEVYHAAFTPDGKTMVTAGRSSRTRGKALCLWDVESGKQRWLEGHAKDLWDEGGVFGISLTRDGKLLASAGSDGTVRVWDVATARQLHCLLGHGSAVLGVGFAPDGKRVVSGGADATARVWDVATGRELFQLDRPRAYCRSVAFSPDGKVLATGGSVVRLWDPATGKELRADRGHRDEVTAVVAVPGRSGVLTAGHDGTVRRWDPLTGEERPPLADFPGRVPWLAVSPDGRRLATGEADGTVRVWDSAAGKELYRLPGPGDQLRSLAFTRDGTGRLVAGGEKELFLWDAGSGKLLRWIELDVGRANCWVLSPDGRLAAAGTTSGVMVWDLATGRNIHGQRHHMLAHGQVAAADFSPDGRLLVSGDWGSHLILWDVATGRKVWDVEAHESIVTSAAFSSDGRTVASGSYDRTVGLWETATGRLRRRFGKHEDLVFSVAFAERGRLLVSGGRDCTGLVWDVTGRRRDTRPPEPSPADLDALWAELAGADAARAHRAIWTLASAPEAALPFLQKRLQAPPTDSKRLARLLDGLAGPDADAADKAAGELELLGDAAAPLLREVLAGNPPAAAREHMERLLKQAEGGGPSPHRVRQLRAVEAIEHAGGAKARATLEALLTDPGDPFLTREAAASLERLRDPP